MEENKNINFTHVALGTFKHPVTGEWMVAKIKYDPVTKTAAEVIEHPAGPSRDFAIELFKIESIREGVVG